MPYSSYHILLVSLLATITCVAVGEMREYKYSPFPAAMVILSIIGIITCNIALGMYV